MGNNTTEDVILRFILDRTGQQQTKAGVDQLTGDLSDVDKIVKAATKDFANLQKQIDAATSPAEFDSLERKLKDVDSQVKDITNSYRAQARVARAEASAMVDGYEKARVARIKAFGDRLGGASRTGLVASGALFTGAFAEANRFAKDAEETGKATQATREWTAATKELATARAQVDTVLLREALPLLKQAAEIASQAAGFIEANPVIVRAALETGKIVAGLSILGILVSKGISLYADTKALFLGTQELAAAKLQDEAADKQLRAALIQAGVDDVPSGKKTDIPIGTVTALITANVAVAAGLSGLLDKLQKTTDEFKPGAGGLLRTGISTAVQAIPGAGAIFGVVENLKRAFPQLQELSDKHIGGLIDKVLGLGKAADKTANSLDAAVTGLAGSAHESEIVSAFTKWKEDDARIVQEAADQRVKIVADAEKRVTAETAKFTSQVASINAKARQRAESLTTNFNRENNQSFLKYQDERAKILKDADKEIVRIEEDHQERLRKLVMEHDERVEDLTAARDALGLAKEQQRFNQAEAEENRGTRTEIGRRRQDIAARLQELDAQYQAEKAQRLVQFQQALIDNEAQRKEEQKVAAAAHAEELKQIRVQKAQQLRELDQTLNAERIRRREVFIAEVRDLDASLLGERGLKIRYYNLMLADATAWLANYRRTLASASTATPQHDYTGYAYTGMYKMAVNGLPEYVLGGAATKAAESIIGGGLTEQSMLSTLARGAGRGSSRSLTINDQSRFDAQISASQVRAIKREAREEMIKEFLDA